MGTFKYPANYWAKCSHGHCTDCATRRGRNRGNRNTRHAVKMVLRAVLKVVT